ncbi:MAG: AAA family ATPase [Eubacteriales bacterium]|nr:AAA family ATPase [Eubacteriales bacterium]
MAFGAEMISQIVTEICSKELRYEDSILIGDNSTGKSELLRRLILELNETEEVYFVDAVNRNFCVKDISRTEKIPPYKESILKTRLDIEHFNLKDSFNCYGTNTERIEIIYTLFEKELQELFYELTGLKFERIPENDMGEVRFPEGEGVLSSGYQAIVRIILELLYFEKAGRKSSKAWIVIDELDEFLSPRYAGKIWGFLKEKFPHYYFVVTTHSSDLLVGADNANLIALLGDNFEVRDIGDYDSNSSVQMIFEHVFGFKQESKDDNFSKLQNLLGKKINGVWTEMDEKQLEQINQECLTASQALIYKQIVEW